MKLVKAAVLACAVLFAVLCFCDLETFAAAGRDGLALIYRSVLPVLFPFFLITGLIINVCDTNSKFMTAVLSWFSGYPNGMRLTALLHSRGGISDAQARHMCTYTSTPSPVFVIATVGTIFLNDTRMGVLIFTASVLGAVINGFIWRGSKTERTQVIRPVRQNIGVKSFNDAVFNAVSAILNVCGIILFFYVLTAVLHLPPEIAGIIEMTTGAAGTINPLIIEFIVSFGGLSIAMQGFIFTNGFKMTPLYYFGMKFTHAVLAAGILAGILMI